MPWGRGSRGRVTVQTATTFLCPPPPFQTLFPTQKTHVPVQNKGQDLHQALRGKQSYLSSLSLIWLTFCLHSLIHPGEKLVQLAFLSISTNWGSGRERSVQIPLVILKGLCSSPAEIPCYLECRLSQQTGLPNPCLH